MAADAQPGQMIGPFHTHRHLPDNTSRRAKRFPDAQLNPFRTGAGDSAMAGRHRPVGPEQDLFCVVPGDVGYHADHAFAEARRADPERLDLAVFDD